MNKSILNLSVAVIGALMLSACGGGGDDSASSSPLPQLQAAACPLGSTNRSGLFAAYAYLFRSLGLLGSGTTVSALTNLPSAGW